MFRHPSSFPYHPPQWFIRIQTNKHIFKQQRNEKARVVGNGASVTNNKKPNTPTKKINNHKHKSHNTKLFINYPLLYPQSSHHNDPLVTKESEYSYIFLPVEDKHPYLTIANSKAL